MFAFRRPRWGRTLPGYRQIHERGQTAPAFSRRSVVNV